VLAKMRADTLTTLLTELFNQYKLPVPKMVPDIVIGGPKFGEPGSPTDPKDDLYKQHQFVKFLVKATGTCLSNVTLQIDYNELARAASGGHRCDFASFYVFANGIQLTSTSNKNYADLNNDMSQPQGGLRYNSFKINDQLAKQILAVSKQIKIEIQCAYPADKPGYEGKIGACHTDAPCVTVLDSKNNIIVKPFIPYKGKVDALSKPSQKVLLCTLDECGKLVQQ
jgi:hypothetical protein